jgi:hypothetical protein
MIVSRLNSLERKQRLFSKLNANLQRRHRESLLSQLPEALTAYLQKCECVYTPESHPLISMFYPAWEDGIGFQQRIIPIRYQFRKLGWVEDAISVTDEFCSGHDNKAALLMLGAPCVVKFQEDDFLVPDVPLFNVTFGWARRECRRLLPLTTDSLAFVAKDLSAGVVIDHEWAVIYDPPHPEAIGFEVATWG